MPRRRLPVTFGGAMAGVAPFWAFSAMRTLGWLGGAGTGGADGGACDVRTGRATLGRAVGRAAGAGATFWLLMRCGTRDAGRADE